MTHWFLAVCHDCQPILPMPFTDERARDRWLFLHASSTGHRVESADEVRL